MSADAPIGSKRIPGARVSDIRWPGTVALNRGQRLVVPVEHHVIRQRFVRANERRRLSRRVASGIDHSEVEDVFAQGQCDVVELEGSKRIRDSRGSAALQHDGGLRFRLTDQGDSRSGGDSIAERAGSGTRGEIQSWQCRCDRVEHKADGRDCRHVAGQVRGLELHGVRSVGRMIEKQRRREAPKTIDINRDIAGRAAIDFRLQGFDAGEVARHPAGDNRVGVRAKSLGGSGHGDDRRQRIEADQRVVVLNREDVQFGRPQRRVDRLGEREQDRFLRVDQLVVCDVDRNVLERLARLERDAVVGQSEVRARGRAGRRVIDGHDFAGRSGQRNRDVGLTDRLAGGGGRRHELDARQRAAVCNRDGVDDIRAQRCQDRRSQRDLNGLGVLVPDVVDDRRCDGLCRLPRRERELRWRA